MSDPDLPQETRGVTESWQETVQAVLGLALLAGALATFYFYAPAMVRGPHLGLMNADLQGDDLKTDDLQKQVHVLSAQVARLEKEQAMPALVLDRYRNSIGYIYGVYQVGFPDRPAAIRARVSGTGFLVGDGLLATNRHVAEPWYGDSEAEALIRQGATAMLESLVVFFPGSATPVSLTSGAVSSAHDLAVLNIEDKAAVRGLAILPLAKEKASPGDLVTVIGYPMGIAGMVAKSPEGIYQRLAFRHNDITAASELAALSLIRPSTTCGHLGDVVGAKLIYDAPTAHGGSGGPVFNANAEVIGVNSAFIDGFSGGTLGYSADALRTVIADAKRQR